MLNNETTTLLQNFQTQNAFDHRFLQTRILYISQNFDHVYIYIYHMIKVEQLKIAS